MSEYVANGSWQWAVRPLRVLLALTFLALLGAELFSFPGMFAYRAKHSAEFAEVRWIVLAACELGMVCIQVIVVATWRLLTMVQRDQVFSPSSIRWVDAIIAAVSIGWLVLVGFGTTAVALGDDPGNAVAVALLVLPASAFALVMIVMRALLLQATALRTDMNAVI